MITNDKDFGEMVYREGKAHRGVILLRLKDERHQSKQNALERLLDKYDGRVADGFVVVTENRIRIIGG